MATPATRRSPATEAWKLVGDLMATQRGWFLDVVREFELSPPQLFALRALEPGEATPMGDLAAHLHCDNSNVTGIVDRLERRGLVERRAATHDRRVKHLVLTDEGVAVRRRIETRLEAGPNPLAALDPADQRALRDLLRKAAAAQES
ncbi:MarR family winged helix-turn-helix transcriptional regulator [Paraconexibacter sp.]|uniref:MarR family winged helix-turn-helix transcriptional regulator n=1 Tax=Paraconexibacter sp. TaxID=2949640 RepID=UPI00356620D4